MTFIFQNWSSCIAKGKAQEQYEFGNKVGLIADAKTLVILAIETFNANPNDSKTIEPLLDQTKRNLAYQPKEFIYDRAGKSVSQIGEVRVLIPGKALKRDTECQKRSKRKKFRVEPL